MRISDLSKTDVRNRMSSSGLSWQVGPFVISARTQIQSHIDGLAFLYQDAQIVDDECIPDVQIETRARRLGRFDIWIDGELHHRSAQSNICMPLIEWCLNVSVFQRPHQYLLIHAAVLERNGQALILPGMPRAGKSTLSAALANRGWRLLSDEVALIRPSDGLVVPVPRAVSLKDGSIELTKAFAPQASFGPTWKGTAKGSVAHMLPSRSSVDAADEFASPGWLVLPQYIADAEASLTPEPKSRALVAAAENCFNYSVLGRLGFQTLADLIDRCDCYRFEYSKLDDAVRSFDALCQAPQERQVPSYA